MTDHDRGQIIIIGALVLSLIILGWITIFNAASFTDVQRADGTLDHQETEHELLMVQHELESIIEHINHEQSPPMEGDLVGTGVATNPALPHFEAEFNNQSRNRGTTLDLGDLSNPTNYDIDSDGTRLWQENFDDLQTETFNPSSGGYEEQENWIVVSEAATDLRIRAFGITYVDSNAFEVTIDPDSASSYTVSIYNNRIESGPQTCSVSQPATSTNPVTIDFTSGTVNGNHCDFLPQTTAIDEIEFNNANDVEGVFSLTVDQPFGTFNSDFDPSSSSPQEQKTVIYSMTLNQVRITTPTGEITTSLRLVPQTPQHARSPP